MSFKPGEQVICVNAKPNRSPPANQDMGGLQFGATYTIREVGIIELFPGMFVNLGWVKVEEINPRPTMIDEHGQEVEDKPFWADRFRRLQKLEEEAEETHKVELKTPIKIPESVH